MSDHDYVSSGRRQSFVQLAPTPGPGDKAAAFLALIAKISDDRVWVNDAACLDADPEVFFPPDGEHPVAAKEICARCPVLAKCRSEHEDEVYGIWYGSSPNERRAHRRERRERGGGR